MDVARDDGPGVKCDVILVGGASYPRRQGFAAVPKRDEHILIDGDSGLWRVVHVVHTGPESSVIYVVREDRKIGWE